MNLNESSSFDGSGFSLVLVFLASSSFALPPLGGVNDLELQDRGVVVPVVEISLLILKIRTMSPERLGFHGVAC